MKAYRAELIAERLEQVATTLSEAADKGRQKAAESLPGDLAKDPHLVDVFVQQWVTGAVSDAVREIRHYANEIRPKRRRA